MQRASSSGGCAPKSPECCKGKHKPIYAPHIDTGDHVIVINADKVVMTSGKAERTMKLPPLGLPRWDQVASRTLKLHARKPAEAVRQLGSRHASQGPARPPAADEAEGVRRRRTPTWLAVAEADGHRPCEGPLSGPLTLRLTTTREREWHDCTAHPDHRPPQALPSPALRLRPGTGQFTINGKTLDVPTSRPTRRRWSSRSR